MGPFDRHGLPYPAPPSGGVLRVAFTGDPVGFAAVALHERSARIHTTFVELRDGGDPAAVLRALEAARPHVVVAFEPERFPAGLLGGLRAATVGFLSEPVPRAGGKPRKQARSARAAIARVDRSAFDRLVAADPLVVAADALLVERAQEAAPVWRAVPLPVGDRYFAEVRPIRGRPRALFLGEWTDHREAWLWGAKNFLDVRHVGAGVGADELESLLGGHDVGVNVHPGAAALFDHRVALHLTAGHLLVSEPLAPSHGLEPGIDFLEVDSPRALMDALYALGRFPAMHDRVRIRGRMKAEQFRASVVWPRLFHDLLLDLRAFGTERAAAA